MEEASLAPREAGGTKVLKKAYCGRTSLILFHGKVYTGKYINKRKIT